MREFNENDLEYFSVSIAYMAISLTQTKFDFKFVGLI